MGRPATLLFDWPGRHTLHLVLPACILLAVFLHAGVFYVFAITYPRPEPAGPNPAQVFFIPPQSAVSPRLAAILQTEDPAIFAPGRGIPQPAIRPALRYTPAYETQSAGLDQLPAMPPVQTASKPASCPVAIPPARNASLLPDGPARTCLVSTGTLASRLPGVPSGTGFQALAGQSLEPTVFLVAVREDGSVAHLVLQKSSGNSQLDDGALGLLKSLRFQPAVGGTVWDEVSIHWGADVRPSESQ